MVNQFVRDQIHGHYFSPRYREIVIKGTSVYDIFGCFRHIGSFIYQNRRVSGSCSQSLPSGGKNGGYYAGTAGGYQKPECLCV